MPEPLKNLLHQALVGDMADRIAAHAPAFDKPRFVKLATDGLGALELMERSALIRDALFATLPADFPEAAAILKATCLHQAGPVYQAGCCCRSTSSSRPAAPIISISASIC
jgi:hypothetical protein